MLAKLCYQKLEEVKQMRRDLQSILLGSIVAVLLVACSSKESKEVEPYKEIFRDTHTFVPINTKELKEIK